MCCTNYVKNPLIPLPFNLSKVTYSHIQQKKPDKPAFSLQTNYAYLHIKEEMYFEIRQNHGIRRYFSTNGLNYYMNGRPAGLSAGSETVCIKNIPTKKKRCSRSICHRNLRSNFFQLEYYSFNNSFFICWSRAFCSLETFG